MVLLEKIVASYETAVIYNNKLWFTEMNCNEFYSYDMVTEELKLICKIEFELEYKRRLFGCVVPYENYMFLIPFSAERIYKINIASGDIESVCLEIPKDDFSESYLANAKYLSAHLYQNKIYLMPTSYPAIAELNCDTGELIYHNEWIKDVKSRFGISGSVFFRKTLLKDKFIYAPLCDANAVLKFNIITKQYQLITIGTQDNGYAAICYDGNEFWIAPRKSGPIVKWNETVNEWEEYSSFPKGFEKREPGFTDIICLNGKIVVFPMLGPMPLIIDRKSDELMRFELGDCITGHMSLCVEGDTIYLFSAMSGQFFIINLSNGQIERKQIHFPEETEEYHKRYFSHSYQIFVGMQESEDVFFLEEYQNALEDYLHYIERQEVDKNDKGNKMSYGKEIWAKM